MQYNYKEIENKWRQQWEETPINQPSPDKKPYYCLDMFPYPSGDGLHVGHWRGYVLSDVWSRYKMLSGYHVLHPMGWDSFGLPAENDAIKKGIHPAKGTAKNIANFKRQLKEISAVYDWDLEINTIDPDYYKWTQWIFIKMFEKGLAYEKQMPINWCPSCKTGLANEEVVGGACDRCGEVVTKKNLRQWMLRITEYAERLLDDLEGLEWSDKVKKMQADWIGKSYGAEIDFKIKDKDQSIKVFTTRADTLCGSTFMILAPEHEMLLDITTPEQKEAVEKYAFEASTKSSVDRMADKEKTGVFTGSYAINPLNNELVPVWTADYVLADYGTGAIMCVPAHDERDFEFAKKFDLPIIQVIAQDGNEIEDLEAPYIGEGVMINSAGFNGLESSVAKDQIPEFLEKENLGKRTTNYKLRDWVFSRQRYWGEPIPMIHCDDCGIVAVPVEELPVMLPDVESYEPTGTGESPLAGIESWVNTTCPTCNKPAKRETNTMPQWAGSSWYFLRYADPKNPDKIASKEALSQWLPVDMYVGGIEHAVLHLLYSRFYTKFLYDIGEVDFQEPFTHLFNQGMITKNGIKMSKSRGNTVSPDELVENYGCDSLRMYELFIGPPELDAEWDDRGIDGVHRFINRLWKLVTENKAVPRTRDMERICHKMVYEITSRMDSFHLNTVVSGFMEHTNTLLDIQKKEGGIDEETIDTLIVLLAPFIPHISEELWQLRGNSQSVFNNTWPTYDAEKMKDDEVEMPIQLNGKKVASILVAPEADKDAVLAMAKEAISKRLEGKNVIKEIYVPGRIINIVAK